MISPSRFTKKNENHHRINYEGPSHQFADWVNQLGLEKTYLGKWLYHLDRHFYLRTSFLVFFFCLILSYIIFFQIVIPYKFETGDVAPVDVNSPINFEMTDEVTTEEKRLKAEFSIPLIFDFDPGVYERLASSTYRSFRLMRGELKEVQWPRQVSLREARMREFFVHKGAFEKEFGAQVPDFIFEWLLERKFNLKLEMALLQSLEFWYEKKIVESLERSVPNPHTQVMVKHLSKNNLGREVMFERKDLVDLQDQDRFVITERRAHGLSEVDRANILFLARSILIPNLTLNKQETASRKQVARVSVIPVSIGFKKNQVILSKGATVQPFHQAILEHVESLQNDRRKDLMSLALAAVLSMCIFVFFTYLKRFTLNKVRVNLKDLSVMMAIATSVILLTKVFLFLADSAFISKLGSTLPVSFFLYMAPVAAGPMLVGLLVTSGEVVWLFSSFMSICLGVMEDFNYQFALISMVSGIAAARGVFNCKTRNDIYKAGILTGLVNVVLITAIMIVSKSDQEGAMKEILLSIPAGFLGGIFSSLIAMMIVPFLESVFNYTTDVKLLELSNLNHPLLKEMIVKAPGTYHHSMMVGSMVEAAAEEIGANPLLGKVMCYYHDIGKMEHAKYFIENQRPGHNSHDHISPFMSKTLLVAHVKDGVEMGMKFKLGKPIIDGIVQHHGTTLISYFYNKALDQRSEGDPEFSEDEFRYPGPKPQFIETALCMLADSIEAAARSLDEPTPQRLQNIVKNVIQRKFSDNQLDDCNLTLREISKVERAFVRILLGIYHQRIDYPRSAGGGLGEMLTPGKST